MVENNIEFDDLIYYLNLIKKFEIYINSIANKIIIKLNENEKNIYNQKWIIKLGQYIENSKVIIFQKFCGLYLMYGADEAVYIGLNPRIIEKKVRQELKQKQYLKDEDIDKCFFAIDIQADKIKNREKLKNENRYLEVLHNDDNNDDLDYYYFGFKDQTTIVDEAVRIIETYYNPT